ncbi:MAG: DUF2141 domain-containing protein [Planctomycetia bacterium]|jgi:uncharacterized protein (DUF2141 family)
MTSWKRISRVAIALLIAACASGLHAGEPASRSANLKVRVDGLRSTRGKILAYIWNQGDGFPSEKQKTLAIAEVAIRDGQAEVDVEVPASEKRLAISVMHDENGNGTMDSNVLGIPLEGYATSNNVPHSMIGPPRYKDAEFEMQGTPAVVQIKMLY